MKRNEEMMKAEINAIKEMKTDTLKDKLGQYKMYQKHFEELASECRKELERRGNQ